MGVRAGGRRPTAKEVDQEIADEVEPARVPAGPGDPESRIGVVCAAFEDRTVALLVPALAGTPPSHDLYLATDTPERRSAILDGLRERPSGTVEVRLVSRGLRAVATLIGFADIHERYPALLHLPQACWQETVALDPRDGPSCLDLLARGDGFAGILRLFETRSGLGLIPAELPGRGPAPDRDEPAAREVEDVLAHLLAEFVAGERPLPPVRAFWIGARALEPLCAAGLQDETLTDASEQAGLTRERFSLYLPAASTFAAGQSIIEADGERADGLDPAGAAGIDRELAHPAARPPALPRPQTVAHPLPALDAATAVRCFTGRFAQAQIVRGAFWLCGTLVMFGETSSEPQVEGLALADAFGPFALAESLTGLRLPSVRAARRRHSGFLALFKPERRRSSLPFSPRLSLRERQGGDVLHAALAPTGLAAFLDASEQEFLRTGAGRLSDKLLAGLLGANPGLPDPHHGAVLLDEAARSESALVLVGIADGLDPRQLHCVSGNGLRAAPCADGEDSSGPAAAPEAPPGRQHFIASVQLSADEPGAYLVALGTDPRTTRLFGPIEAEESRERAVALALRGQSSVFGTPPRRAERLFRPLAALPPRVTRTKRHDLGPTGQASISLIVPFYGDAFYLTGVIDLQRILDDRFEIVVVVDDPRLWQVIFNALDCRRSYLRTRIVLLRNEHNAGYAAANNIGARAASGEVLLLMNADVYVREPSALIAAAEAISARAAAGAKELIAGFTLQYEDHSTQHVEVQILKSKALHDLRLAEHPMKGLPFSLYEPRAERDVEAVTGALLGISASFYRTLGGLDEDYVRGDFEDVDLCLRARQQGAEVKTFFSPSLFHFERQAIVKLGSEPFRQMVTYVNALRFNRIWAERLDRRPRRVRVRRAQAQTGGSDD